MSDEQAPLIKIEEERRARYASDDEDFEDSVIGLRTFTYGSTDATQFSKVVPFNERIVYSWSDVNVFVTERNRSRWRFLWLGAGNDRPALPRKHILKNVHGVAHPGELLAILGSSGAGKTTLLNALTFRSPSDLVVTGLRCVNGIPVNSSSLTSQSAYVQQDDLFIGSLTVKEHLIFQIDHNTAQVAKHNDANSESEYVNVEETEENSMQDPMSHQNSQEAADKSRPYLAQKKALKRKRRSNNKQEPGIVEYLLRKESELARRKRDECELYGELVTMKLKKMDEVTRQYVMNNMDNLMFQAVIHNRHTSRSSTASPPRVSPALSFSSQASPSSSKSSPNYNSRPSTSFDRSDWGLETSSKRRASESPELDHRPIVVKEECE